MWSFNIIGAKSNKGNNKCCINLPGNFKACPWPLNLIGDMCDM